jgi:ribosomal protein L11 methyltransferase
MVEQMGKINFKNKTVPDFGTGTGIPAILAEKVGAASIIAIENDEWSINNALENIKANHCKRINLEKEIILKAFRSLTLC